MKKALLVFSLCSIGCAYVPPLPTEPSPTTIAPARVPTQMTVRVIGPDNWYPDRLFIDALAVDQRGATLHGIVACDVSQGHLEPRQWDTANRSGVLWKGVAPGASFSCRFGAAQEVEASYVITKVDWEMRGCCGSTQPTPPKPPVVPPTVPTTGS